MEKAQRRLFAVLWVLVGLALTAPAVWFVLYRQAHQDASMRIEALVFMGLVAFFGLQIALRSLWTVLRGT